MCPSVPALFNKLSWIPFFEEAKVVKCALAYKRIGSLSNDDGDGNDNAAKQ